ncbi:MAG TPA: leucyl/phenylalanyl-tRNA--protein transferase, partial [Desulfobulbaceae bacterium]|nr:leucyl/phenylalanyl-tRNA--protein transferase [Desulfobulbaceae bacterium]
TWITDEMQNAYTRLHELGYAHSVECRQDRRLVGGLYGICLDRVFFGESMFAQVSDASKVALTALIAQCLQKDIQIIDCQMTTAHLLRFGAREVSGATFRQYLKKWAGDTSTQKKWRPVKRKGER